MRSHNVTVFEFNPKSRVGQRLIDDTLHLNGFFFRQGIFFSLELKGWRIVQKPRGYCNERFIQRLAGWQRVAVFLTIFRSGWPDYRRSQGEQ